VPWLIADTLNPQACGLTALDLRRHVGARATDPRDVLVLSFGRSDCAPCRSELPELRELANRSSDSRVMFVFVILDESEEGRRSMIELAVEQLALPFPVIDDRESILARRFGITELPLTILVERSGKLVWKRAGYSQGNISELAALLP
jgi:thiol-disulfide isomerase/thioredoxin